MSADKRKVIIVTDGDRNARKAVEIAARNVEARCISCSVGNPTRQTGEELVELIKTAPADPVVLMLDDRGYCGMGNGERALAYISRHPDIQVLGVLAVASNITGGGGCTVDLSVAGNGEIVREASEQGG
ncbi:MAG: stage V sporulation protein AE [Candidatus Syntrophopropionicum ammoniitolerans]